jgi:hypothetical protein
LRFSKGGPLFSPMPQNLKRITGRGDLHFITFCCYQRRPLLASARSRSLAVQILKEVRARYGFSGRLCHHARTSPFAHQRIGFGASLENHPSLQAKTFAPDASKETYFEGAIPAAFSGTGKPAAAILAAALLRFQCLLARKSARKTSLHALQSGPRETRRSSRRLAVEQLVLLLSRGRPDCHRSVGLAALVVLWQTAAKKRAAHPLRKAKPQRVGHPGRFPSRG